MVITTRYGLVWETGSRFRTHWRPRCPDPGRRGEYSMCMGVLPPYCRPFVSQLPWYRYGKEYAKDLAGISIMAVAKRLANPSNRADLLNKLQSGRDAEGKLMGGEELTAEAQTFLIAGSDTTSK